MTFPLVIWKPKQDLQQEMIGFPDFVVENAQTGWREMSRNRVRGLEVQKRAAKIEVSEKRD